MINVNNWLSLEASIDNDKPKAPAYPAQNNCDNAWDKYYYDLEQYNYQTMLNGYVTQPATLTVTADIKFKGIG